MGWDKHKLLWDGTGKYVPWTTLGMQHHIWLLTWSGNVFWFEIIVRFFLCFLGRKFS